MRVGPGGWQATARRTAGGGHGGRCGGGRVGRAWAGGPGASRPGPEPSPRCAGSDHSVAPGAGPGLCQARLQPAGISVGSPGATSRPRWGLRFCGVGREPGSSTTPPVGCRPLSVDAELPECGTNPRAEGWPGPGAVGEPAQACPSIPGSPPWRPPAAQCGGHDGGPLPSAAPPHPQDPAPGPGSGKARPGPPRQPAWAALSTAPDRHMWAHVVASSIVTCGPHRCELPRAELQTLRARGACGTHVAPAMHRAPPSPPAAAPTGSHRLGVCPLIRPLGLQGCFGDQKEHVCPTFPRAVGRRPPPASGWASRLRGPRVGCQDFLPQL